MKKIILLTVVLLKSFTTIYAQVENIGSDEFGRLFDVNYDKAVPNRLFAVTLGNHIVRSNDNGTSWEVFLSTVNNRMTIKNLKMIDNDFMSFVVKGNAHENFLIVYNLNNNQIEKFFELPIPEDSVSEDIVTYSIFTNNTDIVLVHQQYQIGLSFFAKVYYTNTGGNTWSEVYDSIEYDVFPNNVAISPNNSQKLFIARGLGPNWETNQGGIFMSTDSGNTWSEQLSGNTFEPIAFHPANPNEILLGTSYGLGGHTQNVYKSTDGGITWNIIPIEWTDYIQDNINTITYNPLNPNTIIILEENEIVITNDNFQTHQTHVYEEDVNSYHYGLNTSFNPFQEIQVFITGNYFPLFSNDGGVTVTRKKNPFFTSTGNVTIDPNSDGKDIYYGVQAGFVHLNTETNTEQPHQITPLNYLYNGIVRTFTDPTFEGRLYYSKSTFLGENLYVSNDNSATTTEISISYGGLTSITANPNNSNIIWAAFYNEIESQLIQFDISNPTDVTATPIALPVTEPISSIIVDSDNPNTKFVSFTTKVYKTIDNGITWTEISTGLATFTPDFDRIFQMTRNPLDANQLTITSTQGTYTTYNLGQMWNLWDSSVCHYMKHSSINPNVAIAVTYDTDTTNYNLKYTTNFGLSWEIIPNLDLFFVQSSSTDFYFTENAIEVYIATSDLGLLKHTIDLTSLNNPENEVLENSVSIYPNPTSDNVNITIKNDEVDTVSLFSVSGELVKQFRGIQNFSINELSNGMYFLKIKTQSGKLITNKIIKN